MLMQAALQGWSVMREGRMLLGLRRPNLGRWQVSRRVRAARHSHVPRRFASTAQPRSRQALLKASRAAMFSGKFSRDQMP